MPDQTKQIGKYQIKIIRDKCISAASCVAIAPQTFKLDEEGIAVFLEHADNGEYDQAEQILLGAQSCPTAAIIIIDSEKNKQIWPLE